MPLFESIIIALRTIMAQKLKSAFSVIGVFISVTFLIAVVTVVEGMNQYMLERFSTLLGANTFQVRRYPDFNVGNTSRETWRAWVRRPRITHDDASAIQAAITIPEVHTAWESIGNGSVEFQGREVSNVRLYGTTASYFAVKGYAIAQGRAFSQQEADAGRNVIVMGHQLAEEMFEGRDPIGREVKIRGLPYRVIGVVESQGTIFGMSLDNFVVAPALSPMKRVVAPPNVVDLVLVAGPTPDAMFAAWDQVESVMRSRRGLRPGDENNFTLETTEAIIAFWNRINSILLIIFPGLVITSLVVGGIIIMNIMLMSVAERTREIGIRKALGARRIDIRNQFLVESATLSVLGAALGIGAGVALAKAIEALTPMPAAIAPWSILLAVAIGAGVGIIAGLTPAKRAALLDPVDAMRQE